MNKKQTDRLINVLFGIGAFAVVIGAIFKLQHYIYGSQILFFGFVLGSIVSVIEINRLRKIIKGKKTPKSD